MSGILLKGRNTLPDRNTTMIDPDQTIKAVGKRIEMLRIDRYLKQADLAGKLDIDVRTMRRIERGESVPSLKQLCQIANILEVGLVELVDVE